MRWRLATAPINQLVVVKRESKRSASQTATERVRQATKLDPRSGGLPAGLIDQPFYGWVAWRLQHQPVSAGLSCSALAMLKREREGR